MWPVKVAQTLSKIVNPVAWISALIGAVALFLMMAAITVDVAGRSLLSRPLAGTIDIVEFLLLFVFLSAVAYAETRAKHIQIEVMVAKFPSTLQQIITTNGYILTIGIAILLAWEIFKLGISLKVSHLVTPLLGIAEWPFVLTSAFFVAVFLLAAVANFLTHLAQLITIGRIKAYLWLLPGFIIALGFFIVSLWPSLLSFEVGRGMWGGIIILLLFALIFLKVHIAAVMALASLLGFSYLSGAHAALGNLSVTTISTASTYTWSVVPLFVWMGLLVYRAGFAGELYDTAYKWVGHVPGGLASATVVACTGLAAVSGSSFAGVLTMGAVSLPHMRKYKYDDKLATATICGGASIGSLIPPSLYLVIYGILTEVSIGRLFMAGFLPGVLFSFVLIALISIRCRINPKLGPPGPTATWTERITSLKGVWAVLLLATGVLGGLYLGIFTANEAGGIGCFGALAIGLVRRRLSLKAMAGSAIETVELTSIILFVFLLAMSFTHFLAVTNLPYDLANWVTELGLSPDFIISIILFIYVILGCVMNMVPALVLTLPIFFPIAMTAGFDPVWFGVVITVMAELGGMTPPIGMNVFAMAIVADVPIYTVFRGMVPFWGVYVVVAIILVLFPQICLFLPSLM